MGLRGTWVKPSTITKNVFHFIKDKKRFAFPKKILCRAQSAQAFLTVYRIAILILAGNLEKFATHILRQYFRQLTFPCTRFAMQKNIDPLTTRCQRIFEIRTQNG
ncbi:hypothetical protein FACS1894101_2510 [Betaproteobacteria bacterium]|nr:hypothetical protein FACS1894101_2510 [Betaproteobacteria bacterium]